MIRILTITSWYPPHHFGGYELSCHDVMTRLAARGHTVRVLCGDERVPGAAVAPGPAAAHEACVFRELRPHLREDDRRRPGLRARLAIERHNRATLERHLAEFKPDVVSVWHMAAISIGLVRQLKDHDVPVLYAVCDNWPAYGPKVDPWMALFNGGPVRAAIGRAVHAATGVPTAVGDLGDSGTFCFVSDATRRTVTAEEPWSFPVSTVVYSGIEAADFTPPAPPRDPSEWAWRLLYVGRLDAWKGVDTLLRAIPHLPPQTTLACYGRGAHAERDRLQALARDLGIDGQVTFGSLERHELAKRYRDADVVVFPSEWEEPFGLVPIEAMACGTPVVATGVGGSGEFLRDGDNCVLFPAGDATALSAAVEHVHASPGLRARLRAGGLRTAAELDVDHLARTFETWHVAAAQRYASGRPPDRVLDLPGAAPAALPSTPRAAIPERVLARVRDRSRGPHLHVRGDEQLVVEFPAGTATVAARVEHLPFRSGAFDVVVGTDAFECMTDDEWGTREFARVLRPGGTALFAVSNAHDLLTLRDRARDVLHARRRPPRAYFHSPRHTREYTWSRFAQLVAGPFHVRRHYTTGFGDRNGTKRALATRLVRTPLLRHFSPAIVIEAEPRVRT